jgi:hypothetical protein
VNGFRPCNVVEGDYYIRRYNRKACNPVACKEEGHQCFFGEKGRARLLQVIGAMLTKAEQALLVKPKERMRNDYGETRTMRCPVCGAGCRESCFCQKHRVNRPPKTEWLMPGWRM